MVMLLFAQGGFWFCLAESAAVWSLLAGFEFWEFTVAIIIIVMECKIKKDRIGALGCEVWRRCCLSLPFTRYV